ncbi:dTDP-4-dehydrorhamnose reductase [Achromobacter agilis]|uniref:dTDP-4-dehydrorhamnose reductase n=1 Tax=Achromobacter agilis TaxID=1353888 RepID=A0A446C2N3_9BURK|nr:dTDP-4-dehydrorhamnose reductase [Achromobacter agilis]SSW62078.1 dTDP-4-dehydrorhamnose reductase [Achromobacter agilis]
MKILLLGKNGQVGRELCRALAPLGELVAPGRDTADLRDQEGLRATLSACRPDAIVNAAAYTAVDLAESEQSEASEVNALAVSTLARHARATDALLVHYSTDYVFDGTARQPYAESDAPNPCNVYGATKLAGEQAIRDAGCGALVFRTSWVYSSHGRNFLKTILRLGQARESLDVVSDQHGAPTSAGLIADTTALAIQRRFEGRLPTGTYHLAAAGSTSWHGFAQYIVAGAAARGMALALAPERIRAILASSYPAAARRPGNSRLDTALLSRALDLQFPAWTAHVDQVLDRLIELGDSAWRAKA